MALTEVRDVFVTESWMKGNDLGDGRFGSRLLFPKDGTLFVTWATAIVPTVARIPTTTSARSSA